jgi:hypothetical protein
LPDGLPKFRQPSDCGVVVDVGLPTFRGRR